MSSIVKGLALSAVLIALTGYQAEAQTGWGALGLHGAYLSPGKIAEGDGGVLTAGQAPGIGASLDLWMGQNRRWGLGTEGTWSRWSDFNPAFTASFADRTEVLTYDASILWRFTRPTPETRFLPFLSLGLGAVALNASEPMAVTEHDVQIASGWQTQLAAAVGIGTDWFVTPNVAARLQLKDYWTDRSPYRRISNNTFHEGGHNIVLNGGLAFYFGRQQVDPIFVREEPIIPEPTPTPPPPPPPATENIVVCVVDPATMRVQSIQAIRVPAEQRVYVMRNGQRVAFETAHPTVAPIYVRNASWYMADRPLVVQLEPAGPRILEPARMEFVLFGTPSQRAAEDLVFLGTIEGTPVYASRTDVAPFRTRLETHLAMHTDLETVLRMEPELIQEVARVNTLYVAVEPNCVFRPVSVTHFVRRTRG